MKELLSSWSSDLDLLARTGYSYLHQQGRNYLAGLDRHLRNGARIRVLLDNPYSPMAEARIRASKSKERFPKLSPERWWDLRKRYSNNLSIRFTTVPVYCSLFFTSSSVIYDPYHLGSLGWAETPGNQFLVFEFERLPSKDQPSSPYDLLKAYFYFMWNDSETITFEQLCAEHSKDLGRYISELE